MQRSDETYSEGFILLTAFQEKQIDTVNEEGNIDKTLKQLLKTVRVIFSFRNCLSQKLLNLSKNCCYPLTTIITIDVQEAPEAISLNKKVLAFQRQVKKAGVLEQLELFCIFTYAPQLCNARTLFYKKSATESEGSEPIYTDSNLI